MQYYLYKKCLKFKNVPIWSEGGGGVNIFQKCLKFKNVPKVGGGGRSTLIGTFSQIFSIFYFDASPKLKIKQAWASYPVAVAGNCDVITFSYLLLIKFPSY